MTERRLLSFPHRLDWVGGFWPQTPITPTLWAQQGSHRQQGSDHPFRFSWTGSHAPPHLPVPEPSAVHAGGLQAPNCGCVGLGHSVDWAIQVLQGASLSWDRQKGCLCRGMFGFQDSRFKGCVWVLGSRETAEMVGRRSSEGMLTFEASACCGTCLCAVLTPYTQSRASSSGRHGATRAHGRIQC